MSLRPCHLPCSGPSPCWHQALDALRLSAATGWLIPKPADTCWEYAGKTTRGFAPAAGCVSSTNLARAGGVAAGAATSSIKEKAREVEGRRATSPYWASWSAEGAYPWRWCLISRHPLFLPSSPKRDRGLLELRQGESREVPWHIAPSFPLYIKDQDTFGLLAKYLCDLGQTAANYLFFCAIA